MKGIYSYILDYMKNHPIRFFGIIIGVIIVFPSLFLMINGQIKYQNENLSISKSGHVFGIDISHYQGKIDWAKVRTSHHPIEFIFIRASMGEDGTDKHFKQNWENAKKHNYVIANGWTAHSK